MANERKLATLHGKFTADYTEGGCAWGYDRPLSVEMGMATGEQLHITVDLDGNFQIYHQPSFFSKWRKEKLVAEGKLGGRNGNSS